MKQLTFTKLRNLIIRLRVPAKFSFIFIGVASTVWFLIRVIPKPSRATYPCMRAASPIMSGFFIYISVLFLSLFAFKKALFNFNKSKIILGGVLTLLAVIAGLGINYSVSSATDVSLLATEPEKFEPNKPVGVAQGIFPGRVVWARDPDATNKFYSAPSYNISNNDSAIINRMTQETIRSLTGKQDLGEAWDLLFKSFNQKTGKGNYGYEHGQKVFIKINCNSAWGHPSVSGTEFNYYGNALGRSLFADYSFFNRSTSFGTFDGNPYTMLSIIDQLVNKGGVAQEDISIGDPMRDIHKYAYDILHNAFPNVKYLGHTNTYGRTLVEPSKDTLVYFSDNGKVLRNYASKPLKGITLYSVVEEADYIINLAALKAHSMQGITSCAKNYFGTIARIWAIEMHNGIVSPSDNGVGRVANSYRVLVDLMGNKHLGGKTMLFFIDGTFFSPDAYGSPIKLKNAPFNNDWPSSVFASQDNVAIESVCYDVLASQYSASCGFPWITMKGICEHLQQAADPTSWPAGITYSPNNDGIPLKSLGVYEHWNNATDQQYSRNLGTGNGIELIKLGPIEDLIAAPVQLSAQSISGQGIKVTWKDNSDKEDGYVVECSISDSLHYSQIGTVNKDSSTCFQYTTNSGTKYYFRVKAFKGSVYSGYSNEASIVATYTSAQNFKNNGSDLMKIIPSANAFKVIFNNDFSGRVAVKVYDSSGKKIKSKEFYKPSYLNEEMVSMNGEKGLFIVSLTYNGKSVNRKVVFN
jgi:hypothetical protein